MKSLFILGRQPALGIAELESILGADHIKQIGQNVAISDKHHSQVPFDRLGGSIKLAEILYELPTVNWDKAIRSMSKKIPAIINPMPEGKVKIGISNYGLHADAPQINRSALFIKKTIKSLDRSVRVVPNKSPALNSAQIIHNQLTSPMGAEILLVSNGMSTIIAKTIAEQDIDSYSARDQNRPKRDTKVGMLPPKLAQIILNIGVANINPTKETSVLDPFCGTGVVLQEALLAGFGTQGSDIDQRMVDYSKENIEWLIEQKTDSKQSHEDNMQELMPEIIKADAMLHTWESKPDVIACETYLGRPFASQPDPKILQDVIQDVNHIHKKFLQNIARQTESGFRMCIAVPAWKTREGFKHLKVLDILEEFGYNRIEFVHARQEDLIYHREGQVVARELVALIRN